MNVPALNALLPNPGAQKKQAADPASFFKADAPEDPVKAEFLKHVKKTPAEQMRASILESMGLKEEDVKAMDPKKREALEAKIKDMIKQRVEEKVEQAQGAKGVLVDIKA